VLGNWGNTGSNASATDLNGDGKIDATDLALALGG
jgi:hypothetical protein